MKIKNFRLFCESVYAGKSRTFRYIELIPESNGLTVKLTPDGVLYINELIDEKSINNECEIISNLFEDVEGNSEYIFHCNIGESGFGLTSAPGITDGYSYDDKGFTTEIPETAKVYWFPDYAIKLITEELQEKGECFFPSAD